MLVCSGPIGKKKKLFWKMDPPTRELRMTFSRRVRFFCQQLFCFQNKLLSTLFIDLVTFYSSVDTS